MSDARRSTCFRACRTTTAICCTTRSRARRPRSTRPTPPRSRAQLEAQGLAADAHLEHASPCGSRRRQSRAQARARAARSSARARMRRASRASTSPSARATSSSSGAHRADGVRHAGPHARPHRLFLRRETTPRSSATRCSRWAADGYSRARPAQMWSSLAEDPAVAGRHAPLLRARVHAEQRAFRVDRRAAESRARRSARRQWRGCAPRASRRCRARSREERATNPFLRPQSRDLARDDRARRAPRDVDVFAKTRALKDAF